LNFSRHHLLEELLRERIRAEGALPFDQFMEECLYSPELGYYSATSSDLGRTGDFYTSVSTGALFGRLLADHIVSLWSLRFKEENLILVEQGCHGGQLALDILNALQVWHPECYQECRYLCVEPQATLRQRQQEKCSPHGERVKWLSTWEEWDPALDCAFLLSNELVDSFPVKLVTYESGCWKESFVTWDEVAGSFVEDKKEITGHELLREIRHWEIPEIEGYRAELNLQARVWVRNLSARLKRGYVLTMDYGFTHEELYSIDRPQGTLSCYREHRRDDNPFLGVGVKDITSHINFSLLIEEGCQVGWKKIYLKDQHHTLIEAAQLGYLQELESRMTQVRELAEARKEIRQFQTLTHPGIMGRQFKFLLMAKS